MFILILSTNAQFVLKLKELWFNISRFMAMQTLIYSKIPLIRVESNEIGLQFLLIKYKLI